jgi:coproporphyrinogen III oxidase-like Fe-S oxidoreductase
MLSLRKDEGFELDEFEKRFGVNFTKKYADKIKLVNKFVDLTPTHFKIKPEYIYVQNTIIIYFMD